MVLDERVDELEPGVDVRNADDGLVVRIEMEIGRFKQVPRVWDDGEEAWDFAVRAPDDVEK